MAAKLSSPGILVNILGITRACYYECSDITRINFRRLGLSLLFTVLICGAVLAASFCEFWLDHNYYFMPLIFIGTALFYYILDTAIIMGDQGRGSSWLKGVRIFIALVLALFNSFLVDYYFFKEDIEAARVTEIRNEQSIISKHFDQQATQKEQEKTYLLKDIDLLQGKLSAQLDSLNAEANGRGGSGHRGIAIIWMAKYRSYQADSTRYNELVAYKRLQVEELNKAARQLINEKNKEQMAVVPTVSGGINKSLELLHQIIWLDGKFTNMFMSILILIVSMLLELVPLIAKSFYDIDEYFEVASHKKDICTTNSNIRKQHAINREAAKLMNEDSMALAVEASEHAINKVKEKMSHSKNMMETSEKYMDELMHTEQRWEEKYPLVINKYGRPILEKSYDILSLATS